MYTYLLLWTIYWFLIWGVFNLLLKNRGVNYLASPKKTILFFALSAVPPLFLIENYTQILYLLPVFVITFCFALALHKSSRVFIFLTSKSVDVFFQHTMVYLLFETLSMIYLPIHIALALGIYFFLIHSPIIFFKEIKLRKLFFCIAFFGGLIFGLLLANLPQVGSALAYLAHMGFYVWLTRKYALEYVL